jgi:hypothetical protein
MLMSHHQNAGQCRNVRTANRAFENVEKFKYLGMTLTNQHLIHEKIKNTLNFGTIYYYSVQHLVLHLLSKNVKIKIHKTTTFQIPPPGQTYACMHTHIFQWILQCHSQEGLSTWQ